MREMRGIRFRAWDKVLGMIYDIGTMCQFGLNDIFEALKGADIVIMQYTGLKDKNGTKIYEGDILTFDKRICLVFFNEKTLRYDLLVYDKYGNFTMNLSFNMGDSLKVIGNIYENPELLEVKE